MYITALVIKPSSVRGVGWGWGARESERYRGREESTDDRVWVVKEEVGVWGQR